MSKAVMKQALDALSAMQAYAASEHKGLRICDEAIAALEAALKTRTTGRPPGTSDVAKIRAHIESGGTWKTLRTIDVSKSTYYRIRRGAYGEVK